MSNITKKRVVIFREELGRYSETFIPNQAERLNNYEPTLLCLRDMNELFSPLDFHPILKNTNGDRALEIIYKTFSYSARLENFLSELHPDIIHIHFGGDACRLLPIYKRVLSPRIPLIVTFHGQDACISDLHKLFSFGIGNLIYLLRRNSLQKYASQILSVSNHIRKKLIKKGFLDQNVIVHYIGVDTKLFSPDKSIFREDIVLYVGRLVEKKGGEYLIRAMALVQKQRPGTELVMIGDGPLASDISLLAKSCGCRLTFLGRCSPDEVRSWMNRARVYCVPSITARNGDSEGLPITVLEAQAMGLPSALFDTAPAREATNGGQTALLAPEKNVLALAENILRLLTDNNIWQMHAARGQELVHSRFNMTTQCQKLESIYDMTITNQHQK